MHYCRQLVRRMDRDGYMCSLMLKHNTKAMETQWILRAFNIEVSRIRDSVSQEQLGKMRFLWWRQSIDKLYNDAGDHHSRYLDQSSSPVLKGLADAVSDHGLSKMWLQKIVKARELELSTRQFQTLQDLEQYSEDVNSSLLYLSLESLGLRDLKSDHIASHVGKAQGIATALRAVPYLATMERPQFMLPADICAKHDISSAVALKFIQNSFTSSGVKRELDLGGLDPVDVGRKLQSVVHECASLAHRHLETAQDHYLAVTVASPSQRDLMDRYDESDCLSTIPYSTSSNSADNCRQAFPVYLNGVGVRRYLEILQRCDFDILRTWQVMQRQQWRLPISLMYANFTKRII